MYSLYLYSYFANSKYSDKLFVKLSNLIETNTYQKLDEQICRLCARFLDLLFLKLF